MPNLPAPYVSPWKELSRNLRALLADLRLRVQELWRRNREGDLSAPGFWPADLAPLFWPLLLAVSLALLVSAGVQLTTWIRSSTTSLETASLEDGSQKALGEPIRPDLPAPIRELPAPEPLPLEEPEVPVVIEQPQTPVPLELDPLLDLFLDGSAPTGVLDAAQPEPDENRLVLRLAAAWWQLSDLERSALAERWLERSRGLGYSDLELVNDEGRVLARTARVGDGMILFNNVPPA